MGIQDIYYKLENGYYSILDKIDKAGLHVYAIVDPIDKVVPSFALILGLFGLIILALIFYFAFMFGSVGPSTPVTFYFVDKSGNPVADANVEMLLNSTPYSYTTTKLGTIAFDAYQGDVVDLNISAGTETEKINEVISDKTEYKYSLSFSLEQDTIRFSVNTNDGSPLKEINIEFLCSNTTIAAPSAIYSSTATDYSVSVDPQCGNLTATVKSNYYAEVSVTSLTDLQAIIVQPLNYGGNNSIVLVVFDKDTNDSINDYSATVSQTGIVLDNQTSMSTDTIMFSGLSTGSFVVSVSKTGYLPASTSVTLQSGTSSAVVYMQKDYANIGGNLLVTVVDGSSTSLPNLFGATVSVYKLDGDKQSVIIKSAATTSDNNATVTIPVDDMSLNYWVQITDSGYITQNKKSVNPRQPLVVALNKLGSQRNAVIQVLDADKTPIGNATVALYDEKDNVVDPNFGITDANGIAADKSLEEDAKYKAYIYKGQYNGTGELFTYNSSTLPANGIDSTVTLTLPKSSWEITLVDKFNAPVPNALVEIYDAYTGFPNADPIEVGTKYASPQGVFSVSNLSTDKKYFAVIKAPSYENYVSIAKFLEPNSNVQETFVLEKERLNKKPVIEQLGIEDTEGKQVMKLGPGNLYKVKFKITLPAGVKYDTLTANFLVGAEDSFVEKDAGYIDRVNISASGVLAKGRAYLNGDFQKSISESQTGKETRAFENDIVEGTPFQDETKWVQLTWNLNKFNIESGQMFVDLYLQVRPGTLEGTTIPVEYNIVTSGVDSQGDDQTYLDPLDSATYDKEHNSLFNNKKPLILNVGDGQQICDDKFCFEMTIFDTNDELKTSVSGDTPYIATLGKNYNMKFNLMNNNIVPLTHYRIVIENPQQNINMKSGVIYSADNNAETMPQPSNFDDYFKYTFRAESENDVLSQNSVIKGDINFVPIVEGSGSIKLTVIEDMTIIYTKELYVSVNANKELRVVIEPEVIPSYVNLTDINFTVYDGNSSAFIDGATVRVVDVYKNVLAESDTNELGVAKLTLKSQLPNIDLKLKVYKEGFKAYEKILKTNDKFVTINPEELKISANIADKLGTAKLTLTNTSELPVKITELSLEGNFDEYVNLREANNYLSNSSLNKTIDKNHSIIVPVNVNLTTIAESLQTNREYSADLIVKIRPDSNTISSTKDWEYKIPVTLSITLGKGLDNLDCLGVDVQKSALVSTGGKNDEDTVNIVNGCTVDSQPVNLTNLEAKVTWKGNALGSLTFNRNEQSARLQNAYYVTLNNKMTTHEEDNYIVDLAPTNGRIAGVGTVEVSVRAGYFADSGVQFVEKKITYSVDVINMGACISYVFPDNEVDLMTVPRNAKGTFTVKNECDTDIALKLDVLPDQFIDIRPLELTVPAKGEKAVIIDPKNSPVGIYLLEVRGQVPKQHFEGIKVGNEALRVFIAPLADDCLVLDNYEFNLMDTNGGDAERYTYLINRCYFKDIKAVYKLDLLRNDGCKMENFNGWLTSLAGSMVAGVTIGSAIGSAVGGGCGALNNSESYVSVDKKKCMDAADQNKADAKAAADKAAAAAAAAKPAATAASAAVPAITVT